MPDWTTLGQLAQLPILIVFGVWVWINSRATSQASDKRDQMWIAILDANRIELAKRDEREVSLIAANREEMSQRDRDWRDFLHQDAQRGVEAMRSGMEGLGKITLALDALTQQIHSQDKHVEGRVAGLTIKIEEILSTVKAMK